MRPRRSPASAMQSPRTLQWWACARLGSQAQARYRVTQAFCSFAAHNPQGPHQPYHITEYHIANRINLEQPFTWKAHIKAINHLSHPRPADCLPGSIAHNQFRSVQARCRDKLPCPAPIRMRVSSWCLGGRPQNQKGHPSRGPESRQQYRKNCNTGSKRGCSSAQKSLLQPCNFGKHWRKDT